jgi:hypothetical protein
MLREGHLEALLKKYASSALNGSAASSVRAPRATQRERAGESSDRGLPFRSGFHPS